MRGSSGEKNHLIRHTWGHSYWLWNVGHTQVSMAEGQEGQSGHIAKVWAAVVECLTGNWVLCLRCPG